MVRKLLSIVSGNRMNHILKWSQQRNGCLGDIAGAFAIYLRWSVKLVTLSTRVTRAPL